MAEITAALSLLSRVVGPLLTEYMKGSVERKHNIGRQVISDYTQRNINDQVVLAKDILDSNKVVNLEEVCRLTTTVAVADIFQDAINYIFQHRLVENITWNNEIQEKCNNLIEELTNQNIKFRHRGEYCDIPVPLQLPGNLKRRFLLYLSHFPESYIFNRKRISRLAAVNDFSTIISNVSHSERPLWIEAAESCWGADDHDQVRRDENRIAFHFTVPNPNNVREQSRSQGWPEIYAVPRHLVHDLNLANNSASEIHIESFLSSLIFLSSNNCSLDLKKHEFPFVRVLSLRNVNLINLKVLGKLSFIRYLDLKNTNVGNCDWLESLQELEVLDLRYTYVRVIPDKCLNNLRKLKHLLLGNNIQLGYKGESGVKSLAGVELNVEQLNAENLERLRAVKWPKNKNVRNRINNVVDLSVMDVEPDDLNNFWGAVANFKKLTILGVAVIKGSVFTLQGCPKKLQQKLIRLQIEGRFTSSLTSSQPKSPHHKLQIGGRITSSSTSSQKLQIGGRMTISSTSSQPEPPLHKLQIEVGSTSSSSSSQPEPPLHTLQNFKRLIDLTLVSPEEFSGIPSLPKLICLRLYGIRKNKTFVFNKEGFHGLKKLVIGDMEKVETVEIGRAIIEVLATLKLCNLPHFKEVAVVCYEEQYSLLSLKSSTKKLYEVPSQKILFLKGVPRIQDRIPRKPNLEIYNYDMGKHCYKKL